MKTTSKTADLLKIMSRAFSYPEKAFFDALSDGDFLILLKESTGKNCREELDNGITRTLKTSSYEQLCSEYIALFDINAIQPPLHLNGGLYGKDRVKTLQNLMKLYDQYGLEMVQGSEQADHLTVELEFMAFLLEQEEDTTAMAEELIWTNEIPPGLTIRGSHPLYLPLAHILNDYITVNFSVSSL